MGSSHTSLLSGCLPHPLQHLLWAWGLGSQLLSPGTLSSSVHLPVSGGPQQSMDQPELFPQGLVEGRCLTWPGEP